MNVHELISSVSSGNDEDFRKIINIYKDRIFTYLYYLTKDRHLAEDLLQETFLKIYLNLTKYDKGKSSFYTWAVRISYNIFVDYKRKNKIHLSSIESLESIPIFDDYNESIEQYLSCLHDLDKQIVLMKYIHEFTCEEIAMMLNIPINTVKTKLMRSKKSIKEKKEEVKL